MRRNGMPSWAIRIDSPEVLNFAIYIGCVYGILQKDDFRDQSIMWPGARLSSRHPKERLASEWSQWWSYLIEFRTSELLDESVKFKKVLFNPVYHTKPELTAINECCEHSLVSFQEWWHRPAGCHEQHIHLQRVVGERIVHYLRSYERKTNRKCSPFDLYIDLVFSGLPHSITTHFRYIITVPDGHFLDCEEWWTKRIEELHKSCSL